MTSDSPHLRMGVLGIVAISLFAALFSRLWFLQVMSAPTFAVAAQTNRERVVTIPPVRGRILDAQGQVLADNRLSNVVTVDRKAIVKTRDRDILLAKLAPVLGVPIDTLPRACERPALLAAPPDPTCGRCARVDGRAHRRARERLPWSPGEGSRAARLPVRLARCTRPRLRGRDQRHRVQDVEERRLHARRPGRQGRRREDLREGSARHARFDHARGRLRGPGAARAHAHRRDPWARRAAHHRPSGAGAGRGLARALHC